MVKYTYNSDVKFSRWRKLLYNASFNIVATILYIDVLHIRASKYIVDNLIRPLMLEIIATAAAKEVMLPLEEVERIITVDLYSSFFLPSMA